MTTASTLEYRQTLGARLKSHREGRGYSQAELAREAGDWRQATLSFYESGKRDIPFFVVDTYAQILDVPIGIIAFKTYEEAIADGDIEERSE